MPNFTFDPLNYPYPSQRTVQYSRQGMVATSQYLAAQCGLDLLKQGGNAVDAAIATAACLTVTEPTGTGIGGDLFALVWDGHTLTGLNGSGRAPASISAGAIREKGYRHMPNLGWIPVTVPGVPAAWAELSKRWGRLSLTDALAPAAGYARRGFPLSPHVGRSWRLAAQKYSDLGEEFKPWYDTFAPGGKAPLAGDLVTLPDHAATLEAIGTTNGEDFYHGKLAEKIDAFSRRCGGYLRGEDLAAHRSELVEPISAAYRDYRVYEVPPNCQGLVALIALSILNCFDLTSLASDKAVHLQIEAIKLAFGEGLRHITDPEWMTARAEDLLNPERITGLAEQIGEEASQPDLKPEPAGGTVYLSTADAEGNMVSLIQSNYEGFGSGLVVPGTGIALHNRGNAFSLDPADAKLLEPGKRPYHTIMPGFLFRGEKPLGPFGVMGKFMQPQGHLQVVSGMVDYRLNPQAALDAPRFLWVQDSHVRVEQSFPAHLVRSLIERGHGIEICADYPLFGRGQVIWRNEQSGILCGATEPRADSAVACW